MAYWAGGCRPLADDDVTLSQITRLPREAWRQHRTAVMAAFSAIRPRLDTVFRIAEAKAAKRSARAEQASSFVVRSVSEQSTRARVRSAATSPASSNGT
jgi:uncharacterized protein YdaU (DUF1376 family)